MHGGKRFRDLGLADAGLTFQQQRALQQLHQRNRGRKFAVGDIAGSGQRLRDLLAVFHCQSVFLFASSPLPPRSGGEGSGVGGGSANSLPEEQAETPPTPDPSPPSGFAALRRTEGG